MFICFICTSEAVLHLKTANSTNRFEAVLQAEELSGTFSWKKPETHAQTLSTASPLFDNEQVFICWIHLYVRLFTGRPRFPAPLLFSFVWARRCRRLPEPSGALCSALIFRSLLWFFKPLHILSFASASGKIICLIEKDLPASLGGGHRPLWLPWFGAAGAFLGFVLFALERRTLFLTVVTEKDVFFGVVRCVPGPVAGFLMVGLLLLLWWFLSGHILRSGGELAVHLQLWENEKNKTTVAVIARFVALRLLDL